MVISCQKAVYVRMQRGVRKERRGCTKRATWNVPVSINPAQRPLVASNYDTTKVGHDYFLCGTHKNQLLKEHSDIASVWIATAHALPKYIR